MLKFILNIIKKNLKVVKIFAKKYLKFVLKNKNIYILFQIILAFILNISSIHICIEK